MPQINNTSKNQKDSQQEINNLNLGKTNSIEKHLNDVKIKKRKNIISLKTTFKIILLKKIQRQKKDNGQRTQHSW